MCECGGCGQWAVAEYIGSIRGMSVGRLCVRFVLMAELHGISL